MTVAAWAAAGACVVAAWSGAGARGLCLGVRRDTPGGRGGRGGAVSRVWRDFAMEIRLRFWTVGIFGYQWRISICDRFAESVTSSKGRQANQGAHKAKAKPGAHTLKASTTSKQKRRVSISAAVAMFWRVLSRLISACDFRRKFV